MDLEAAHPPPPRAAWIPCEVKRLLPGPAAAGARPLAATKPLWPFSQRVHSPDTLKRPKDWSELQSYRDKFLSIVKQPPYFVLSVITLTALVQAWKGSGEGWLEWRPERWWRQPWRLLSYGAVHASADHLALNALVALLVGWPLELEQSWWRVGGVWAGGLVAGALGVGALQPTTRVVGASAAIYALLTSHISNVCLRFGHVPLWWFRPLSVAALATSEALWFARSPHDQVAWAAHVLGAAAGVPLAFLLFTGENRSKTWVGVARVVSTALLAAAGVAASCYYAGCAHGDCHYRSSL